MVGQGSGSLEERLRRLEREVAGHRQVLDLLRRDVAAPPSGDVASGDVARRGGFAAFETRVEAVGEEAPREERALDFEPAIAGANAGIAAGADDLDAASSRPGGGEGWNLRLPSTLAGIRSWEWWLNKVGIALLLFGVAFLFKFSWDRGWLQAVLTPWVRVGLGTLLGGGLIALGLRMDRRRRGFAAVLLGGGIGTLYITTFAAYAVLDLVPHAAAFGAMVAVTALAFALSLSQDEPVLSLVATVGGLVTPFVLYTEGGSIGGLVLYTSLILAGTASIYMFKGWRSLLAVSSLGTWSVMFAAVAQLDLEGQPGGVYWAAQFGVAFAWLVLWLVPAAREVLRGGGPASWPLPAGGPQARPSGESGTRSSAGMAHALSFGTPLLALALTGRIWPLDEQELGYAALAGACVYAVVAWLVRTVEREGSVAYVSGLVALVLATLGMVTILEGATLFAALALEAAAMHLVARRFSDRIVLWAAHGLSAVVVAWLGYRLLAGTEKLLESDDGTAVMPFLGAGALVDLGAIALLPVIARFALRGSVAEVYRFVAYGALSLWIARGLVDLPEGLGLVVFAWTAYAVALFVLARRWQDPVLAAAAHLQFGVLSALVLGRVLYGLAAGPGGTPVFNLGGMADLVAILVLGGLSFFVRPLPTRAYRATALAMLLLWFWGQFASLPSGDAYVTIAWGLVGVALLVGGLRVSETGLMRLGLGTLFLVVGKLFLWDLAGVDAIWRVLLFLGFGGLFLTLSYYLQSLWRGGDDPGGPSRTRPA